MNLLDNGQVLLMKLIRVAMEVKAQRALDDYLLLSITKQCNLADACKLPNCFRT